MPISVIYVTHLLAGVAEPVAVVVAVRCCRLVLGNRSDANQLCVWCVQEVVTPASSPHAAMRLYLDMALTSPAAWIRKCQPASNFRSSVHALKGPMLVNHAGLMQQKDNVPFELVKAHGCEQASEAAR